MSKRYDLMVDNGNVIYTKKYLKLPQGESLVAKGKAFCHRGEDGSVLCFELLKCEGAPVSQRVRKIVGSYADRDEESSAAISPSELEAIVGLRGVSVSVGWTEARKDAREKLGRKAEDFIERALHKLDVYQTVH